MSGVEISGGQLNASLAIRMRTPSGTHSKRFEARETRTAMKRRFVRFVTPLLVTPILLGALATAREAKAQEIQLTGPLKGAPAVRKLRQFREGRFELAPTVSFTLLDEYRRTILPGARLTYNIKDWIGIGLWGAFGAISTTTDLSDQIDSVAPRDNRTAVNVAHNGPNVKGGKGPTFVDQTATISYVAAPQVTFVPFRGKLAIFQKIFVDTDFYASAGVAFVGLQERGFCGGGGGAPSCTDSKSFALASRTAVAPTFGLGFSFYTGDFVSLGLEYRALPFSWNRAGFDARGGGNNNNFPDGKVDANDQTFKWNQMITLAVGFSFPTMPHISP